MYQVYGLYGILSGYPVNPEYPGPKQAGPDEERLRLKRGEYFDEALKYCLNCKRCEVACRRM